MRLEARHVAKPASKVLRQTASKGNAPGSCRLPQAECTMRVHAGRSLGPPARASAEALVGGSNRDLASKTGQGNSPERLTA